MKVYYFHQCSNGVLFVMSFMLVLFLTFISLKYMCCIYIFFLLIPRVYIRPGLYWLNAAEIENRLFKILVKKNNCHGDAILISSKLNLWDSLSSSFFQYSKHNLKYTKHKQKLNFKFFFISFLVSNLKNGANIFTALIDFDGSYLKNCSSPLNIN